MVVLFLFVLFYLVLPRWADQESTARQLREVNPILLLLAVGLEISALLCYAMLTKVTLPEEPRLGLFTVFRIQLATRAVTNIVPGGSAAGSTLGFRLFTQAGVPATAAGFTMATVGIGSAVVLNLILWTSLVISIPLQGFKQVYVGAAMIGVLLLAAAAFLVWSLMEGRTRSERVLRSIFRRTPFVREETASRFVHQLAERLQDLASDPDLIRRGVVWSCGFWLLDAASLWVFLRAFGHTVDPIVLIVAFGVAQVAAAIPITPGGLGVVETALPAALTGFGVPGSTALAGVLTWRFAQYWMPIPLGGLSYLTIRFGRIGRRAHRPEDRGERIPLSTVASRRVWDDEAGEFRWKTTEELIDDIRNGVVAPEGEPIEPTVAPDEPLRSSDLASDGDPAGERSGDADEDPAGGTAGDPDADADPSRDPAGESDHGPSGDSDESPDEVWAGEPDPEADPDPDPGSGRDRGGPAP